MNRQPKILLVPGYGTEVTKQFTRPELSKMRGFEVFANQQNCELFSWGLQAHLSLWNNLNPVFAVTQYITEKKMVYSTELLDRFIGQLKSTQPEIIVAHSLGTVLTLRGLQHYLPLSLKEVVFVQSDLRMTFENTQFITRLGEHVTFKNIWCFWDQALLSSMIINRSMPLGLIKTSQMKNYFVPLYKTINLHESSLSDKKLLNIVYAD
jgi:hypothetical protein